MPFLWRALLAPLALLLASLTQVGNGAPVDDRLGFWHAPETAALHLVSGSLLYEGSLLTKQRIAFRLWSLGEAEPGPEEASKTDSKGRFRYRGKQLGKTEAPQRLEIRFGRGGSSSLDKVAFIDLPMEWEKTMHDAGEVQLPALPLIAAGCVLDNKQRPVQRASVFLVSNAAGTPQTLRGFEESNTKESGFFAIYGQLPSGSAARLAVFHNDFDRLSYRDFEVGESRQEIILQHGVTLLVKLLLDGDVTHSMLSLEAFPMGSKTGASMGDRIDEGLLRSSTSLRRVPGEHRLGPFPAGAYQLNLRQRIPDAVNRQLERNPSSDAAASKRIAVFQPLLFATEVHVSDEGDAREMTLEPIDLRGKLKQVQITCVDQEGKPIRMAGIAAQKEPYAMLASNKAQSAGEQPGAEDAPLPEPGQVDTKFLLQNLDFPMPLGDAGQIKLVTNLDFPQAYVVSADDFVAQTIEGLIDDVTLKLRPKLPVRVNTFGLMPLPDGVRIEGTLVPLDPKQLADPRARFVVEQGLDYRALDANGSFLFGVDLPGQYELRLCLEAKGEKGTFRVYVRDAKQPYLFESFDVQAAGLGQAFVLESKRTPLELSAAMQLLEKMIWG